MGSNLDREKREVCVRADTDQKTNQTSNIAVTGVDFFWDDSKKHVGHHPVTASHTRSLSSVESIFSEIQHVRVAENQRIEAKTIGVHAL